MDDGIFQSQTDTVSVHVSPRPEFDLHPETINLKSKGGAKSVTGILFSPVLSSFAAMTASDGVTVTAEFTVGHRYTDLYGDTVTFTTPVTEHTADDFVMEVDKDGDGTVDGYELTLKIDRQKIIQGFTDTNGNLKIVDPTDLTSTVYANAIDVGSDVNKVISPPAVSKGGKK